MKEPRTPHFTPHFATRVRDSFARQAVMTTLGVALDTVSPGHVVLSMPFRADLTQQHGFLHAGIVTTVLDSACGYAAFSLMAEDAEVLTVEFKSNFLRPAAGDHFRFDGQVLKSGRSLIVAEGRAYALREAGEETLISSMSATLMAIEGRADVTARSDHH